MDKVHKLTDDLLDFINNSPTAFHASENIAAALERKGYVRLHEEERWELSAGGRYYVMRNDSAVIALALGTAAVAEQGFRIIGAHTDSPLMKVKHEAETISGNYARVPVEVYGGPIINTWLDRELSIAGRVMLREDGRIVSKNVRINKPVAVIPNLAIHMNRDVNKGVELNKQNHLPAVIAADAKDAKKDILKSLICDETGFPMENIVDADLFLFDAAPGLYTGAHGELITAGRLDDLAMCHAILQALPGKKALAQPCIGVFYDNEEIGSTTRQGADSSFLADLMLRVNSALGGDIQDMQMANARSFMISGDMAHALHPNFADKHDPSYAPRINRGPVIKLNANFRYATTADTAAAFEALCLKAGVPFQRMTNRSDIPSGSTIGPVSSSLLGIRTVDVGNPMWAMHSIRETCGLHDHWYMTEVFKTFFS